MAKTNVLVLCVDRDDDLGVKANVRAPVIGKKEVLKAAQMLGLADPSDSDVNAMFRAVQLYDELKKKGENVEVAVVTGSKSMGIESDRRISEQLDKVLKKFDADEIVFVSDGASDEQVIPLISRKVPNVYVDRIVVNQAVKLESTYFVLYNFIKNMINNPHYSRLFLGVPAIALMLYAFFGSAAVRLIIGFIGVYLFLKGFQLEESALRIFHSLSESASKMRFSLFLYLASLTFFIAGAIIGTSKVTALKPESILNTVALFINASVYAFGISAIAWCVGAYLDKKIKKLTSLLGVEIMIVAFAFLTDVITNLILVNELTLTNIAKALAVVGLMLLLAVVVNSLGKKRRKNQII